MDAGDQPEQEVIVTMSGKIVTALSVVVAIGAVVEPALAGTIIVDDVGRPLASPGALGLVAMGVVGSILLAKRKK